MPPKTSSQFAAILVADFSLQALLRLRPDLAGKSIALLDGDHRRATIIALTEPARAAGVVIGLTAPQALSRCPELCLEQAQPHADDEASASLLAAAANLSPLVEDTSLGVATADVTALATDQREPCLQAALDRLASLGLAATAGLAATPLLALYAARAALSAEDNGNPTGAVGREARPTSNHTNPKCGSGFMPDSNLSVEGPASGRRQSETKSQRDGDHFASQLRVSDVAALETRPDLFRDPNDNDPLPPLKSKILTIADAHEFLAPLPLEAADPEPDHIDILRLWGITTLGQLTALTKADVAQRLGPSGLALWERAAGQSTRPIQPLPPPQSFAAEMELEHIIESLEPLMFLLRRFIDRLCLDLQGVALAAAELDLCLRLDDETSHQRSIRLPEPTASPDLLFRTLQSHLETITTDAAIVAIRLELYPTRPLHRQQGLFDAGLRDPHGFAETLARAAALLGSDQVGTPQLANTHRPDSAILASPSTGEIKAPESPTTLPAFGVPLRRFRPPLPARVELQPASRNPAYLWTENISGEVRAHHGPWRASGDWWQADQSWAREEWDIALGPPRQGLYRLSHTPSGWYLDGEYD